MRNQPDESIICSRSVAGGACAARGLKLYADDRQAQRLPRIETPSRGAIPRDTCEVVDAESEKPGTLLPNRRSVRVAFHPPCTLQHGQKITGVTARVLGAAGFELTPMPDSHLCCGSAGTYSILQPELANHLKKNKLAALASGMPVMIVSSSIGCQNHLAAGDALDRRAGAADCGCEAGIKGKDCMSKN